MSFQPITTFDAFKDYAEDLFCAICHESFEDGMVPLAHAGTGKPHVFHAHCIKDWVASGTTCPVCRLEITDIEGESVDAIRRAYAAALQETSSTFSNGNSFQGSLRERSSSSGLHEPYLQHDQEYENYTFAQNTMGHALCLAIENNDYDEALSIALRFDVSQDYRGSALIEAIRTGYSDIAQILLQRGAISQKDRGQALITAVANGYFNIAHLILTSGEIHEEDLGEATLRVLEVGYYPFVVTLLHHGDIDEDSRGQCLSIAAQKGLFETSETLLENGEIDPYHLGLSVKNAIGNGHYNIARLLLSSGAILMQERDEALEMLSQSALGDSSALIHALENAEITTGNARLQMALFYDDFENN